MTTHLSHSGLTFKKYQGAGNDFVIIDNRENQWEKWVENFDLQPFAATQFNSSKPFQKANQVVFQLCHRYFGIGADGLMLLQDHQEADFEMVYFNSDGYLSSMCGNGGRCIAHFANNLGIGAQGIMTFIAPDGKHAASVNGDHVSLSMNPVTQVKSIDAQNGAWELNTGSPHYIQFLDTNLFAAADLSLTGLTDVNFVQWAKGIRYNNTYQRDGINVNAVEPSPHNALAAQNQNPSISMRTYERGVENETLSCGTGVTAAAIAYFQQYLLPSYQFNHSSHTIEVKTKGGDLAVTFGYSLEQQFHSIYLNGPAECVFEGILA